MKKILGIAASLALASALAPAAQAADSSQGSYLTDKAGNIIMTKSTGLCVRTKQWTPQTADRKCMAGASRK